MRPLLALLLAGSSSLVVKAVLQAETFAIGDHVTWNKADKDVPNGSIGTVVKVMDKGVVVKFLKGQWGFKVSQLRPMSFSVGDKVTWTREDADVPHGSVGTVMRLAGDGVVVQFSAGKWLFNPNKLRMADTSGSAVTTEQKEKGSAASASADDLAAFAPGDHVMWTNVDVDVPQGSIGTVLRVTHRAVVAKFFKGTWAFDPKQLHKVSFDKGQRVTWTSEDKDIPRGTVGIITEVGVTGISVKFPKGEWNFNPGQLKSAPGAAPPALASTSPPPSTTTAATTSTSLTRTSTTATSTYTSTSSSTVTSVTTTTPPPSTTARAVANTTNPPVAGAARHGGFRVGQRVTWAKSDADIPQGSIGTVVSFKDHAVVVRFEKGQWGFDPGQLRRTPSGHQGATGADIGEEESFCCFASRDNGDACGTCHATGRALGDSFCGRTSVGCHACGGAWCETEPDGSGDMIAHVVMRKDSDSGALREARFGSPFQWVLATASFFATAAGLAVAGRRLVPRAIAAARIAAGRRGVDTCGQPLFERDEREEEPMAT